MLLDLQLFALANEGAVKYADLTDEHIVDVKKGIELFVKSNEYWDKFAHHSVVPKGHREWTSRRLIKPKVRQEDIKPRAELVAPRPSKMAVATFTKTVDNYGDKAMYTKEDIQFHFDDTVVNLRSTLQEIAVQKLDLIKGAAFVKSRAIISPVLVNGTVSLLETLENASIILRKNEAKRWANNFYLVHVTPEIWKKIKAEVRALGVSLDEHTKVEINGKTEEFATWGDFMFSVCTSDILYKGDKQIIVIQGRRAIDGESGVDVSRLEGESGITLYNNGLGSGILIDEDGNYTADDNRQQGAIAINMDGLGADISDDLVVLNCEVTIAEIAGTALAQADKSGFVSTSPASTLAFNVADETGAAVNGATITLKHVTKAGETVIDAVSGKYPVVAGDTYKFTVENGSGASKKTAAGKLVAGAGNTVAFVTIK